MATNNYIVTGLPEYVEQNRDLLLKNFGLLGAGTRQRISIQTGIKKSAALNYFEVEPVLQDGSDCGFTAEGTATLTQREINVAPIKVNMDICPKKLRGTYAEYLIRMNATENTLPFEEYLVDQIIKAVNVKVEDLIWLGDTAQAGNTDLKWFDGFIKQMSADDDVIDVALAAGTNVYSRIMQVYMNLPEEVLKRGAEIYVSPSDYRAFMMELTMRNLYHFSGAVESAPAEYFFPGTDVKVVKTEGLAGTHYMVGTFPKNLIYGTDMEGDEEDIDIWWSQDDRVYKLAIEWVGGVAYAYPDLVVLGTSAGDPVFNATTDVTIDNATINNATINEAGA